MYFEGYPSWQTTDRRLRRLAAEMDLDISQQPPETPDGPAGSPLLEQLREVLHAG